MRVSRTRFSKRRIKRKTEFPIVAVVQKKRKVESIKSLTFGILSNQSGVTNKKGKHTKTLSQYPSSQAEQNQVLTNGVSKEPDFSNLDERHAEQKKDKVTQKNIALKPQKKSRATIDYKNIILLRNLITAEGKILPRRINKATAKQQRYVQKAIKSARIMGLIPFINKSRPF